MTEQLPINIEVSKPLTALYPKIVGISNKLEAQFNFQTMTANWYGDESNLLSLTLHLLLPEQYLIQQQSKNSADITQKIYADDVFSNEAQLNKIDAFLALTEKEQLLLEQHNKLLAGFIDTKIRKVINLIAADHQLSPI
jgi:hypothetical protein